MRKVMGERVWIVNHYADDPSGQATRTFDLSKRLVQRGHQVTIFAAGRSHYTFQERHAYGRGGATQTLEDGVRFVWLKTPPYQGNGFRRFWNIMVFALRVLLVAHRVQPRPTVVVGVTVHPLAAFSAWVLAVLSRARFYYEITDLWPDTLVDLGAIPRRHPVVWLLRVLDSFLLRRARRVMLYWPYGYRYLEKHGLPAEKAAWVPHCADFSRYETPGNWDGGNAEDFTVLYLGGLTSEYGLGVILDAARLLRQRGRTGVRFRFVGGGSLKPTLRQRASTLGLTNVTFDDPVPKSRVGEVISTADALVFTREDMPLLMEYGISNNKLCDYLASSRPILFSCSAANDPIREAGAGISVPAQDATALADAVDRLLMASAEERIAMGQAGRAYAERAFDVEVVADTLEGVITERPVRREGPHA